MAEVTTGVRALLSHAGVYNLVQRALGAEKARRVVVREYLPEMRGLRLLDIGCGTAEILRHLPSDMDYTGFDASDRYIAEARRRFGDRGCFRAERVSEASLRNEAPFDVVVAFGLLHHLGDDEAGALFRLAARVLSDDGVLVTIDPAFSPEQSRFARWLIRRDRGRNVRDSEGYTQLARRHFPHVRACVRHDLLHVPYTHVIVQCRQSPGDFRRKEDVLPFPA